MAAQPDEKADDKKVQAVDAVGTKVALKDLRAIDEPFERTLKYEKDDEEMYDYLVKHYGDKIYDMYHDLFICFIQGYAHEKEREKATVERIDHFLDRQKEFEFKTMMDEPSKEDFECLEAWPVFIYGYDKQGHPVMYDDIASSTVENVKKCFANEKGEANYTKLRKFRFRFLRRLENSKVVQKRRYNRNFYRHVMVMDMQNFSRHHLYQPMRDIVQTVITDESNLWPNTLHKMFIINAPWAFRMAWKVVSQFVHPITVEKINILGGDYIKEMSKFIDMDQIPKKFGGKGELPIDFGYVADIDHSLVDCFYKEVTMGHKLNPKKDDDDKNDNGDNNNNKDDQKNDDKKEEENK